MSQVLRMTLAFAWLLFSISLTLAQTTPARQVSTGGSISGRVIISGNPASGIPIGLYKSGGETADLAPPMKTLTDQDGRYHFTGLAPGRHLVVSFSTVYAMPNDLQSGLPGKSITLNEDENLTGIDFALTRGAVITGKVIDADGRPLTGERVTLISFDAQGRKRSVSQRDYTMGEIDDRGIYRFYGLSAGRYIISAGQAADGVINPTLGANKYIYQRIFHPSVIEEAQAKVIELGEGQEATGIDIALGRPTKTFVATGRVIIAETGQSVPNVNFAYGRLREGSSVPTDFGFTSNNRSNAQGEFRLEGILPGRYAVFTVSRDLGIGGSNAGADFYSEPTAFEL
jgi:protocatechuate 3,4-dioxygenase beta subunit